MATYPRKDSERTDQLVHLQDKGASRWARKLLRQTTQRTLPADSGKAGAGGGTRTRTTFYGPRILSPVRLPFRHTGTSRRAVGPLDFRRPRPDSSRRV